jgi:protein-S-isoprenylcysteine O-methyltransferase Ste14
LSDLSRTAVSPSCSARRESPSPQLPCFGLHESHCTGPAGIVCHARIAPPPGWHEACSSASREAHLNTIAQRAIRPAAWAFYVVIVFEILFMISPFALHFYASYGPVLDVLHHRPATAWLTKFYLPHFTETKNPVLNGTHDLGMLLIVTGLAAFLAAATPVYWAKLRGTGPVTRGPYVVIRHPQYLALAITGVGTALVWPRFLVLLTLVTMVFLYAMLADWEEQLCLARFGESYRRYQSQTGRFVPRSFLRWLPRVLPDSGRARGAALAALYLLVLLLAVGLGFRLRDRSLAAVAALYDERTAVLSTAYLERDELEAVYGTARSDARIQGTLADAGPARFIVYVVPEEWFLPDLPLDQLERGGGHHVPASFDRTRYKVLFTRARFHGDAPSGAHIVKAAYGREPLTVAHVDARTETVTRVTVPPPHVRWGDISTPMF